MDKKENEMLQSKQIFKGNIIHTPTLGKWEIIEHGYVIVDENGKVESLTKELPMEYRYYQVYNFNDKLIIPAFVDLHVHASQFPNRGLCLDYSLIDWLFQCTFPLEARFADLEFAKDVYDRVLKNMWANGNLHSLVYNTISLQATKLLFDMFVQSGMCAFIGKVNMDINVPDYLKENTKKSLQETELFIQETKGVCDLVKPIIAPRFVPSCSSELLEGLGKLAKKYDVPVMSHLDEDVDEIELVHEVYPNVPTYADVYNQFGLLGQEPTVMAHCIYCTEREMNLLKDNGVWVAHCPSSNFNLGSGLMPVRNFINMGIKVGLGSDVAGGGDVCMLKVMESAVATSKIVWLYTGRKLDPLKMPEAFYLATKGGGSFFGKVGSFEVGYDFDALVIDDHPLIDNFKYSIEERIERFIYLGNHSNIIERYIRGRHVPEPSFT